MTLRDWIREQGDLCEDADIAAAEFLGMKVRTIRAIRHGAMNPSPKVALHISKMAFDVSFRECFDI